MNLNKATKRDRKRQKRKYGHVVDGRSVFVIEEVKVKKALKIKKEREEKEKRLNGENSI